MRTASGSRPAACAASRITATASEILDRSARLEVIQPSAIRPARSTAGRDMPPSSTGGPGRWTGRGSCRPAGIV
jgi:hypothetical protein